MALEFEKLSEEDLASHRAKIISIIQEFQFFISSKQSRSEVFEKMQGGPKNCFYFLVVLIFIIIVKPSSFHYKILVNMYSENVILELTSMPSSKK